VELENIEDKYLLVLNSICEGIWILDKEWRFTFVNEPGARFVDLSPNQLIGRKLTDVLPGIEKTKFHAICEQVRRKQISEPLSVLFTLPNGSKILYKIHACPPIPQGILCIGSDIEKYWQSIEKLKDRLGFVAKMMEKRRSVYLKSEQRFKAIVENAPMDILVIQDNKFVFTNFTVSPITGYSKEEISRMNFWEIVHPEYRELVKRNYQARLRGEYIPLYECKLIAKDGSEKWVTVAGSRIEWKERPADIVMLSDITQLKQTERKLREAYGRLNQSLKDIVKALSKLIERRDPYTAGHQERVAKLACAIAEELGLSEEQIIGIRLAGLLHDMGKISIPAEILTKPQQLNKIELDLVKTHPQVAYEILKEIEFSWPVAEIVYQHHERWDGSGYLRGLKGDEILLEARILAVADVVEAMSSHRPYRPARAIEEALKEILRNRGKLYDPDVVDACIRLFREKKFTL